MGRTSQKRKKLKFLSSRTWSGNVASMKNFESKDFKKVCVLENHRGEGIDTIYYVKELK